MYFFKKAKVLCTLAAGPHLELFALARPKLEAYARRHGYDVAFETELLDASRPASWSKVLLIQRLLRRYRAVVWIDSDAVIVDPEIDILADLPRGATLGLVAHRTVEGDEIPNLGVIAARSSRASRAFFAEIWEQTAFIDHKWWENAAALALFGYTTEAPVELVAPTPWRGLLHLLDERWNSLSFAPAARPRIVHFAGQSHAVRLEGMKKLADQPVLA